MKPCDLVLVHSLFEIYNQPIVETDGGYVCPVCNKKYKQLMAAQKHLDKQDCAKAINLFKGTLVEEDAYQLFVELTPTRGMSVFRKSKMYSTITNFIAFCILNEVEEIGLYLSWQMMELHTDSFMKSMAAARYQKSIKSFRKFIQANPNYTIQFFQKNKQALLEDPKFLVKSVETGRLSISHVLDDEDFIEVLNDMPIGYFERLSRVADA